MRLRRPCEHKDDQHPEGHYERHGLTWMEREVLAADGEIVLGYEEILCPGGEFLPEDAIVIEPGSMERRWWCKASRALREAPGICISSPSFHPDCCWVSIIEKPRNVNRCFNCRGVGLVRRDARNVICPLCQGTGLLSEDEAVRIAADQVGEPG